jgi:hypothetical protein
MEQRIERASRQLSSVTLVAAAVVITPTMLGVGPSLALAVGFLALGGVLGLARLYATVVPSETVRWHLETLWLGPILAGLAVLLWLEASIGELQAIGGLIGLVGVANYLLRPVYAGLYWLGDRLVGGGRPRKS